MSEMRERRDKEIERFFKENRTWTPDELRELDNNNIQDKIDVIWKLNELLKADQEKQYLGDALKVAAIYYKDPDPAANDDHDKRIRKGEDVRYIYTVRATLAYLVATAIGRLDTSVYPQLIQIVDALLQDENAYVRMHSIVPLRILCMVVYATKKEDGTSFDLSTEDRKKIQKLAFRTLDANHDIPRVLEFLTEAIGWLRRMDDADARHALNSLIFVNQLERRYQPSYVLRDTSALLIFYAEFRTQVNDGFDATYFKQLLRDCLAHAPSEFRSSIIWHFWKTIEEDHANIERLKVYIPDFFQGEFDNHFVQQLSLFTEHVLKADVDVGIETYVMLVDYVLEKMNHGHGVLWFLDMDRILPLIGENKPDAYINSLRKLKELLLRKNVFIADYQAVFTAYSSLPAARRKQVKEEAQTIYKELQKVKADAPDLVWPE